MIRILRKKKLLLNQIVRFNSNKKKDEYLCIDPWSTPICIKNLKKQKIDLKKWAEFRKKREKDPNYKRREIFFDKN